MARVSTIIVGGGVGAVAPFTLNSIPFVSNTDPASLSTTDFFSVVLPPSSRAVVIGTADPASTATEILRVSGGLISQGAGTDSLVAGRGSVADGTDGVALGRGASAGTGLRSIAIGAGNDDNTTGNDVVAIGANIVKTAGQSNVVIIGSGITALGAGTCINGTVNAIGGAVHICIQGTIGAVAGGSHVCLLGNVTATPNASSVAILGTASGTGGVVAIGNGATASGAGSVAIGPGNTTASGGQSLAIGFGTTASHSDSIAIGRGVTFGANQLVIGNSLARINTICINGNTDSAPTSVLFRIANASGNNVAGGNLTLQSGLGTGTGTVSAVNFDTPTVAVAGATLQTAVTRGRFDSGAGAGTTGFMLWDVDNNTLERVTVGAADSGGAGFKVLRIPN